MLCDNLKEDDPGTGHEAVMCGAVFTCGHRGSAGTVTGIKARGGRGRGTSVGDGGLRAEMARNPKLGATEKLRNPGARR